MSFTKTSTKSVDPFWIEAVIEAGGTTPSAAKDGIATSRTFETRMEHVESELKPILIVILSPATTVRSLTQRGETSNGAGVATGDGDGITTSARVSTTPAIRYLPGAIECGAVGAQAPTSQMQEHGSVDGRDGKTTSSPDAIVHVGLDDAPVGLGRIAIDGRHPP